jgi:proline iminopeptidase
VAAGNAQLHFRDIGVGPSIVVLHGGPDFDYDYLLPELDRLAEWFRIIYYDQRGRGRSADGVRPDDVTVESEMDDLDHVRRHFGLDSMAVLGHSWGGVLAMEYASRHPERLTHLILMNTAPASNRDVHLWRQHLHRIRRADDVEAMQFLAATEEFCAGDLDVESEYYRIHYRPALYAPALLDRLIPRLRASFTPDRVLTARAIEQRLYDETWSSPGYDLHPRLRRVAVPALIIHGENDFVPVDVSAHVAGAMPEARLVVLQRCGHFAYLEAPNAVVQHIRELFAAEPTAKRPWPAPSGSP